MYKIIFFVITFLNIILALAEPKPEEIKYYRELTLKIRTSGEFKIPILLSQNSNFSYKLELGDFIYKAPIVSDTDSSLGEGLFYRNFWDRVFLKDGSSITLNGEEIPLTCIFVSGQDNRFSGNMTPLFPQFFLKIYLVANDYTCTGPLNPNWPSSGTKKENWDTYLYYEVRDPTIMLPTEIKLRYRWNELHPILVK